VKVVVAHNYYQQPGGEDVAFESEAQLLEQRGHRVVRFTLHNDKVRHIAAPQLAAGTIWNIAAYREMVALLARERPDVLHVHNFFPLMSPAVYYAAQAANVPVVQTLHNYRLLCPSAILFRDGHICEECVHRAVPTPGVRHACYRGKRTASAAVAAMSTIHRLAGTWVRRVDLFVALTEFARARFVAGGMPADKVVVKPNFAADPRRSAGRRLYAVFVGRLTEEKGYRVLLEAWRKLAPRIELRVLGDGPGAQEVARAAATVPGIRFLGRRPRAEVVAAMTDAQFLVFPSVWFETFGLAIIEAFALGVPVIASRLGSMAELVRHGQTGLHFEPGNPADLARQVERALEHPAELARMGRNARLEYERCYTPDVNYAMLMTLYGRVAKANASVGGGIPDHEREEEPCPRPGAVSP
jgi:glycosyltransferase involved in cell wall biosynthesis